MPPESPRQRGSIPPPAIASLDSKLESENEVLEALVFGLAKNALQPELWTKLHDAAQRDNRMSELAFAYESFVQDRRVKALPPAANAEFMYNAANFFTTFGDELGAMAYLQRALTAYPAHLGAFERLEAKLIARRDYKGLAELYIDTAQHRGRVDQAQLLRRAVHMLEQIKGPADRIIELLQQVLRLDAPDEASRIKLVEYFAALGRSREEVRLLEQGLNLEPAPTPEGAHRMRARLIELFAYELAEVEKSTPHVEALLAIDPENETARKVAERLLEVRGVAARAAAALTDAHEASGKPHDVARYLSIELEHTRGSRRLAVLRRLGVLLADRLGNKMGAFDAIEQALTLDPSEGTLRERYVALAVALGRQLDAAKMLAKVAVTAKDAPVRARITADIGQLFAAGGDRKRARAVYASVLATPGVPDDAALRAARALTEIYEADGDLRELGAVLERRAALESDVEVLRACLERWADLAMGPLEDPARAIAALRRLLEIETANGPLRERALESLERLYLDAGEVTELAWVMGERAVHAPPREARSLMMRAAEALTAVAASTTGPGQAATDAHGRAIAAWRRLIERFGPSRDVYGSFIPLLEEIGDWAELAQALEADAALVPESDRGATLAKAGVVRLQRLRDVPGAIDAFRRALASDAGEKTARAALEKLLAAGDYRVAAAQALEPLYRAEESVAGLLRVLEVRATLGEHPEDRLSALDEATQAAELSTTHRALAIEYAGRGLSEAVQSGHPLEAWVERVQTLAGDGEAKRRATIFGKALGDRPIESQSMLLLARHAGDAMAEIGDVQAALALLRRALEYDPSATEIVRRVDGLLRDQGNPHERLVLYRAALERERDASQQRRLLHAIGAIARHELKDPDGAIQAYKSALDLEAEDRDAYAALCELYEEVGAWAELIDLLEMRLAQLDGGPDSMRVRAQLAETAANHAQPERAGLHARALLGEPALTATELDSVERVAEVIGDVNLSSEAFERRAAQAGDPRDAIAALGKLGAARQGQGNTAAAVDAWKRAARAAKESNELDAAQRFYELVRKAAPLDAEANTELALLLEAQERWSTLPELYGVLVDTAKTTDARCAVLLRLARVLVDRLGDPSGAADAVARAFALDPSHAETLALFERLAVQSGEIAGFVRAIDSAMQEAKGPSAKALRTELMLSKARVLAKDPQRQDDTAETYRGLLRDDSELESQRRPTAVGAFAKWLEASDASPARNADRRWLLAWRADQAQGDEKIGHLVTWARAEETIFSDVEAALGVHRRVLALDPENTEASAAVARLTLATGDVGGAISALFAQRERSDGAARRAIDIEIATILIERGAELDEAVRCVAALLDEAPDDADALGLAGRLLRLPKVGQEAAALLEKASHRVEDSDVRANIVNTLLEGPPEVAGTTTRRAWFERLIASHDEQGRKDAAFLTTLRAAEEFPLEASFWDRAEDLAREMQNPGSLADLYYRVLGGVLSPDGALEIGQRAVAFHEEWFDDPSRVIALLERVLTIDPSASWAFDRLKLLFDSREQWDDLFALYDRAVESAPRDRQVELLEDAAQIAKDFANHADRAILYLEKLLALKPQNARITASLERLYERYGKHRELIALLTGQLDAMSASEARATRIRIAGMLLDHLEDVPGALSVVEGILTADERGAVSLPAAGDAEAAERLKLVELLERILQAAAPEGTSAKARQHAASLLKEYYVEAGRDADLARVLEVELEAVDDSKARVAGHKEIAAIYGRLGRDANALEHYVALVLLEPEVAEHRDRLTALAEKVDQFDRAAEVLAKAAEQASDEALRIDLLMRAATMHEDKLGDGERAIALYLQVLALPGAADGALLAATRRLDPLLLIASRPHDRLMVLERMSALETDPRARRTALGTAAELAAELGEDERAIAAYSARLGHDDADAEALDGLIVLLERGKRWRPLLDALTRRASITPSKEQKRADRVALARIHRQELEEPEEAIAIWRSIQEDFGPSEEGTRALAGLLHGVGRWTDLASLLESSAKRAEDPEVRATFLRQLGDVLRERLDDHPRAIANYRAALEASPREPGALDGLYELVDAGKTAESRAEAVRVLYGAHTATGEWQSALDLTEHRLKAAESAEERGRILKEAAWLAEHRIADRVVAYGFVGRAFVLAPHDLDLETDLFRLAEETSGWKAFVETHRRVLENVEAAPARDAELLGRLHQHLGEALERRLEDAEGALSAYAKAVEITPHDTDAVRAVLRVAGPNMRWDAVARAVVLHAIATHALDASLWTTLESAATTPAAWDAATDALTRNIAENPKVVAHLARDLEAKVAAWHRDRRGDPEAAEAALARALVHDPRSPELLGALAQLQRRAKGRPLVESLLRLSEATGGDLELLREAAEIANDSIADRALAKSILERLMKLATERWFGREPPRDITSGTPADPEQFVRWTIAALSRIYDEEGDAAKTVDLLVLASELPFDSGNRRTMRHQAAKIAVDRLGDRERAIGLFQALFAEDPSDHEAAGSLAELFQQQGRHADLLELREKQLAAAPLPTLPALRLEVARLKVLLGRPEDAVATLQANLKDEPRHDETVRALVDVYQRAGRYADLTALLADQAALAEAGGDNEAASLFWARAASAAEDKLDDTNAAITYHARVVAIEPRAASYDALARLSMRRQDWSEAAQYLVLLRDHVDPDERAKVTLRLADALVSGGREDLARERLESAVAEQPREETLRAHLGAIYQRRNEYAPLAALLATGAAYAPSSDVKLLRLREAADLYWHKCNMPAEAVPLLEQAAELDPESRAIRLLLADTLGAAGRIQEGRALLRAAIEAFGGRRPKERAPIHYHLARLDLLAGDRAPALAELEAATRIDPANAEILRTLAELARDDGELDRAERSYRALLSVVRRQDQPDESTPIVRTEVLLELSEIARRQGQADRADEILESALEAASLHPVEASRLEQALRARASWKALAKALEMKLARVDREHAAAVLFELADVLGNKLGREDDAFAIGLRAIEAEPDSPSAHDAMLELAKRTRAVPRYVDTLARLAKAAGAGDTKLAGSLYLRLGAIVETELEDDARALGIYEEAEALESDSRDVLRALERLYGRAGKREGQERVLSRLVELEASAQPPNPAQHADALARLAAMRLSAPGGVEPASELLGTALALDSENVHALSVLQRAIDAHPDRVKLLDLYEQTGRRPGQERLLLDALQRRSQRPDTATSVLREAISLAQTLGEKTLVEELLERYVAIARSSEAERAHATWALVLLAECAEGRNELRDGLTLRIEAADYAEPDEARKMRMFVARTASDRLGDPYFAAKVYERLFEQKPDDRDVWEPLAALYRKVGDVERLARLLGQVTDTIDETEARSAMRLERARILLTGGDAAKADAVFELRRILEEQSGHEEAGTMLLGILETNGREEELTELLNQQIDAAKDRGDSRRVATLSARLGAIVERQDPQAAIGIYYAALDWDPKSEPVLRALSRLLVESGEPADRAELLERLIPLTSGPEAEKLTLELVSLREELWDTEGGERAIAIGFKACPESTTLRDRLLHVYRERGDTAKLAEVQVLDAMAQTEPAERAARLRKTATLYLTEMKDAARAAELLQEARTSLPDDKELFDELIAALTEAGLFQAAATEITSAASALPDQDPRRAPLLAARASLRGRLGDQGGALYDLERAFSLDPANYVEPLTMQLARLREEAIRADDTAKEAAILLRLVNLLAKSGHTEAARMHLGELLTRDPNHREALRTLGELEETLGHWDVASATYRRLALIDDTDLSDLALKLANTSERAGELGFARPVLERALRNEPTNTAVRERLRELYARTGAHRELAEMSLAEARTTLDDDLRFTHLVRGAAVLLESGIEEQVALAALEEARTIRPNDIECAAFLADALLALGRPDEANALMHTTLAAQKGRRSRDLALLHQRLARVARTVGDRPGELQWLSSALDMDGQNGLVASELARSALELRQYDVATKALRTITMLRGSAPIPRAVAYQRLGEIAHVQGDTKKALLLLKRAVDDDPTLEEARALLHALSR